MPIVRILYRQRTLPPPAFSEAASRKQISIQLVHFWNILIEVKNTIDGVNGTHGHLAL
jgi:hypothetical protein